MTVVEMSRSDGFDSDSDVHLILRTIDLLKNGRQRMSTDAAHVLTKNWTQSNSETERLKFPISEG